MADIAAPAATLPVWPTVREGYGQIWRHRWIYLAQVTVWAIIAWLVTAVAQIAIDLAVAHISFEWQMVARQALYIAIYILLLIYGGTAMLIGCLGATLLGMRPKVRSALRLRRRDLAMLRAVATYWLVVHLVPTTAAQLIYLGPSLQLGIPDLPIPAIYLGYWAWVMATAPFVVLGLPIALFEETATPFRQALARLRGNRRQMFAVSLVAFAPIAVVDLTLHDIQRAIWSGMFVESFLLLRLLDALVLRPAIALLSFTLILVMSSVVAAAYARLSPRLETVYRVFD